MRTEQTNFHDASSLARSRTRWTEYPIPHIIRFDHVDLTDDRASVARVDDGKVNATQVRHGVIVWDMQDAQPGGADCISSRRIARFRLGFLVMTPPPPSREVGVRA